LIIVLFQKQFWKWIFIHIFPLILTVIRVVIIVLIKLCVIYFNVDDVMLCALIWTQFLSLEY
jgi:hypothetical protein